MIPDAIAPLYPTHIQQHFKNTCQLLQSLGYEQLLIGAGDQLYRFRDDGHYPFKCNPYFTTWLPLEEASQSLLLIDVNSDRPQLFHFQPEDIWHKVIPVSSERVQQQFALTTFATVEALLGRLQSSLRAAAYIGPAINLLDQLPGVTINPQPLLNALDYRRAYKSPYEQGCLRLANRLAVKGHRAAAEAFAAGASEFGIHMAYLEATGQLENELPYTNIIALNENAAVLHYMQKQRRLPGEHRSFLIDAGADVAGYAADISRTYAASGSRFAELITAMDQLQRDIIGAIKPGGSYIDLHITAHRFLAGVLSEFDLIDCTVDEALETGITGVFFPHGLGHLLGVQVHDRGGWMHSPEGDELAPPDAHPYLRLTRRIEANMVFTIEPGLYFIPPLLAQAHADERRQGINWREVEKLQPYGGIRIEDDILLTNLGVENLTREAGLK